MAAVLDDLDDLVGVRDLASAIDAVPRLATAGRPGAVRWATERPKAGPK
jgi:hypothetical protein